MLYAIQELSVTKRNLYFSALSKEEKANVISHGFGVVLFMLGGILLLSKPTVHLSQIDYIGAVVYILSLLSLYASSTIYHMATDHGKKAIFKVFDHAAIFILIAGTYTPFLLGPLRNHVSIFFLLLMWIIALTGIIYKNFYADKIQRLSTFIYLAMGWMAIIKIKIFYEYLSAGALWWILIGGLFYSVGTVFYSNKNIRFNHAIWHLFVLGGSISHFIAIYLYVY